MVLCNWLQFKPEGSFSNFVDLSPSILSERTRMARYKPQKAHGGIHKSPMLTWPHSPSFFLD